MPKPVALGSKSCFKDLFVGLNFSQLLAASPALPPGRAGRAGESEGGGDKKQGRARVLGSASSPQAFFPLCDLVVANVHIVAGSHKSETENHEIPGDTPQKRNAFKREAMCEVVRWLSEATSDRSNVDPKPWALAPSQGRRDRWFALGDFNMLEAHVQDTLETVSRDLELEHEIQATAVVVEENPQGVLDVTLSPACPIPPLRRALPAPPRPHPRPDGQRVYTRLGPAEGGGAGLLAGRGGSGRAGASGRAARGLTTHCQAAGGALATKRPTALGNAKPRVG